MITLPGRIPLTLAAGDPRIRSITNPRTLKEAYPLAIRILRFGTLPHHPVIPGRHPVLWPVETITSGRLRKMWKCRGLEATLCNQSEVQVRNLKCPTTVQEWPLISRRLVG